MRSSRAQEEREQRGPSQTARVTLALREMLLEGRFKPGERIREIPLAGQLKVSRIPLRLALDRLAHEGLLEVRPTRGFIVQQFSKTDIRDAIELRGALEGQAARLAAERLRAAQDAATLEQLAEEMVQVVRGRKLTLDKIAMYIELNAKFHTGILDLSRSRLLRRAMEHACSLPFASPSAFLERQYTDRDGWDLFLIAADQHRAILEAIVHREGMRAEMLAREHARIAARNLENALKNQESLQLVPGGKLIKL